MVGKSQLKRIRSLQQKKYRNELGLFFVEGKKTVHELLNAKVMPFEIYTTSLDDFVLKDEKYFQITPQELKQISQLKNPNGVLGVFYMPKLQKVIEEDWVLVLDDVRDPGNLGTIIRLCDWFGIKSLVCSEQTVDCYNPKVLQATMGSIARVAIHYTNIEEYLNNTSLPVFGAFMNGAPVYNMKIPKAGVLVMGNEGNGISHEIEKCVHEKISIPQYGNQTTESLNVATATAILLNEVRRN